jgi:hypothetical protein
LCLAWIKLKWTFVIGSCLNAFIFIFFLKILKLVDYLPALSLSLWCYVCHCWNIVMDFFGLNHKIFIWSFLLLCWRDWGLSPRFDLSFLFYRKERSIQGDHAILKQYLYSFLLVGRLKLFLLMVLFPLSGFWFYGLAKGSA